MTQWKMFFSVLSSLFVITTVSNAATTAYNGYVFGAVGKTAYLVDPSSGATVHTWTASGAARSCAYLLPDGSALFPISPTSGSCAVAGTNAYPHGRVQKISWDGTITWDALVCNTTFTPGYDLEPMPNGNILLGGISNTGAMKVVEIQPSGSSGQTVVWELALPSSVGTTGYINSVSYNPDLDYIAVNIAEAKKLVVINRATKSIVYTYTMTGGSTSHAAKWVHKYFLGTNITMPDADTTAMRTNNLIGLNNSLQVVEVNPVASAFVKNIPFTFSAHQGSVQRLPNGNTLVNAASNKVTEITDAGTTVRSITLPGSVYRAYMYGPSYPGLMTYATTHIATSTLVTAAKETFVYNAAANTGKITFDCSKGLPLAIHIYSLSGKIVYSTSVQGNEASFSTKKLLAGIYYLDVHYASSGSFCTSFVKM